MNFLQIVLDLLTLMFRLLNTSAQVEVELDGILLDLPAGMSLAAALIAAGQTPMRHNPVSHAPRTAYCMMGSCFECVIEVDGINQRACQIEVVQGMCLRRPGIAADEESKS
jgi:predicted molibdopterin-dependent oxidoreductase YjgC